MGFELAELAARKHPAKRPNFGRSRKPCLVEASAYVSLGLDLLSCCPLPQVRHSAASPGASRRAEPGRCDSFPHPRPA